MNDRAIASIALLLPEKFLAICSLICLLLAAIGSALIAPHNRLPGRGGAQLPMRSPSNQPILQIELARSESDLVEVLAAGDTNRNLEDAKSGNDLDTFLFIPSYAGLLISTGLLVAHRDRRWQPTLVLVAIIAVPAAAVCDWLENAGIASTISHFHSNGAPRPGDARRISRPSLTKWTILALVLLTYGISAGRGLKPWYVARIGMAIIAVGGVTLGSLLCVMLIRYTLELNSP
jgi:hypothetical protein